MFNKVGTAATLLILAQIGALSRALRVGSVELGDDDLFSPSGPSPNYLANIDPSANNREFQHNARGVRVVQALPDAAASAAMAHAHQISSDAASQNPWITGPDSKKYQFNSGPQSWLTAREHCLRQNADLVSVDGNQTELDWLIDHYKPEFPTARERQVQVGLMLDPPGGGGGGGHAPGYREWRWVNGKSLDASILSWEEGEPFDHSHQGRERCGLLNVNARKLVDVDCDEDADLEQQPYRFICERTHEKHLEHEALNNPLWKKLEDILVYFGISSAETAQKQNTTSKPVGADEEGYWEEQEKKVNASTNANNTNNSAERSNNGTDWRPNDGNATLSEAGKNVTTEQKPSSDERSGQEKVEISLEAAKNRSEDPQKRDDKNVSRVHESEKHVGETRAEAERRAAEKWSASEQRDMPATSPAGATLFSGNSVGQVRTAVEEAKEDLEVPEQKNSSSNGAISGLEKSVVDGKNESITNNKPAKIAQAADGKSRDSGKEQTGNGTKIDFKVDALSDEASQPALNNTSESEGNKEAQNNGTTKTEEKRQQLQADEKKEVVKTNGTQKLAPERPLEQTNSQKIGANKTDEANPSSASLPSVTVYSSNGTEHLLDSKQSEAKNDTSNKTDETHKAKIQRPSTSSNNSITSSEASSQQNGVEEGQRVMPDRVETNEVEKRKIGEDGDPLERLADTLESHRSSLFKTEEGGETNTSAVSLNNGESDAEKGQIGRRIHSLERIISAVQRMIDDAENGGDGSHLEDAIRLQVKEDKKSSNATSDETIEGRNGKIDQSSSGQSSTRSMQMLLQRSSAIASNSVQSALDVESDFVDADAFNRAHPHINSGHLVIGSASMASVSSMSAALSPMGKDRLSPRKKCRKIMKIDESVNKTLSIICEEHADEKEKSNAPMDPYGFVDGNNLPTGENDSNFTLTAGNSTKNGSKSAVHGVTSSVPSIVADEPSSRSSFLEPEIFSGFTGGRSVGSAKGSVTKQFPPKELPKSEFEQSNSSVSKYEQRQLPLVNPIDESFNDTEKMALSAAKASREVGKNTLVPIPKNDIIIDGQSLVRANVVEDEKSGDAAGRQSIHEKEPGGGAAAAAVSVIGIGALSPPEAEHQHLVRTDSPNAELIEAVRAVKSAKSGEKHENERVENRHENSNSENEELNKHRENDQTQSRHSHNETIDKNSKNAGENQEMDAATTVNPLLEWMLSSAELRESVRNQSGANNTSSNGVAGNEGIVMPTKEVAMNNGVVLETDLQVALHTTQKPPSAVGVGKIESMPVSEELFIQNHANASDAEKAVKNEKESGDGKKEKDKKESDRGKENVTTNAPIVEVAEQKQTNGTEKMEKIVPGNNGPMTSNGEEYFHRNSTKSDGKKPQQPPKSAEIEDPTSVFPRPNFDLLKPNERAQLPFYVIERLNQERRHVNSVYEDFIRGKNFANSPGELALGPAYARTLATINQIQAADAERRREEERQLVALPQAHQNTVQQQQGAETQKRMPVVQSLLASY